MWRVLSQRVAGARSQGHTDLAGTEQSADPNGVVEIQTGLGNLTVHCPGAARNLEKGDKIILHFSYSMDSSAVASSPP